MTGKRAGWPTRIRRAAGTVAWLMLGSILLTWVFIGFMTVMGVLLGFPGPHPDGGFAARSAVAGVAALCGGLLSLAGRVRIHIEWRRDEDPPPDDRD